MLKKNDQMWVRFSIILLLPFLISACSGSLPTVTPVAFPISSLEPTHPPLLSANSPATKTPSTIVSLTLSPTPTKTPTPTLTSTAKVQYSTFDSLPPGQYIVYEGQETGSELTVLSLDGAFQQRLMNSAGSALTPNGRQVLISTGDGFAILDLEQNTLTSLNPPTDRCGRISSSPDFTVAVMGCKSAIYILSLQDGTQYPLFMSDEPQLEAYYDKPLWSPDGKRISFFYYNLDSVSHPENRSTDSGLYLVDTTCLEKPSTCPEKTKGPFQADFWMQRPYSWSPDSQNLVMVTERTASPFLIFNVQDAHFHTLEVTGGWDDIYPVSWSTNGRWIAYSRRFSSEDHSQDIFIMPADGGGVHSSTGGGERSICLKLAHCSLSNRGYVHNHRSRCQSQFA